MRKVPTRFAKRNGDWGGWAARWVAGAAVCLLGVGAGWAAAPQKPVPAVKIPLAGLGYQSAPARFALQGISLATVDFADDNHLLVTFVARRLLPRIADDPVDDDDHLVDAVLVELPSGKVVGRTAWRTHDSAQYLWNMGKGRFLLRRRNDLDTFSPMANLASGEPFKLTELLSLKRQVAALKISADGESMLLETVPPKEKRAEAVKGAAAPSAAVAMAGAARDLARSRQVELQFVELETGAGGVVRARVRGESSARAAVDIPMTGAGYLEVVDDGKNRWGFNFDGFDGKVRQLGGVETTCRPHPFFVSAVEFVAFGCRGGVEKWELAGLNLRGEVLWVESLGDNNAYRSIRSAPAAGRVAFSRAIVVNGAPEQTEYAAEQLGGQDVRVLQMESGAELLRVDVAPIQKSGENYAIAPDGLALAVIKDAEVQVYALPKLSGKEKKIREGLMAGAPAVWGGVGGPKVLRVPTAAAVAAEAEAPAVAEPVVVPAVVAPAAAVPVPVVSAPAGAPAETKKVEAKKVDAGTADEGAPRKPPSLYTLPGDPAKPGDAEKKPDAPK